MQRGVPHRRAEALRDPPIDLRWHGFRRACSTWGGAPERARKDLRMAEEKAAGGRNGPGKRHDNPEGDMRHVQARAWAELVAAARRTVTDGLVVGTSGNVSVRIGDTVLVTPSGVPYDRLGAEDV